MSIFRKIAIIFTVLVLLINLNFKGTYALDDYAQELTETTVFDSSNTKNLGRLTDDYIRKAWETPIVADTFVSGYNESEISGISLWFKEIPRYFILQVSSDGLSWSDEKIYEDETLYNSYFQLESPSNYFRILCPNDEEGKLGIIEVRVFAKGELTRDVHVWLDTEINPDIMIFSAHPDDEFVFFSGIVPYYSAELQKKVTVVYMTNQYFFRKNEAYNALWIAGEDSAPIFAPFLDAYSESVNGAKRHWGEEYTLNYLTALIREYQPNVIISHDLKGEYGHGQHMYTAHALTEAVLLASDKTYDVESYEKFGIWEVKKLYLHLYKENPIVLDWDIPMESFDGLTAIEVSKLALNEHQSQLHWSVVRVRDKNSSYPSTEYGLFYTTVGLDTVGGDFLENVPTPTPIPTATPSSTPTIPPTLAPTATPTIRPALAPTTSPPPIDESGNDDANFIIIILGSGILLLLAVMLIIQKKITRSHRKDREES